MTNYEQFEQEAHIGFWEYNADWLRVDVITSKERTTLLAMIADIKDYIDEQWDNLHEYRNSKRRLQQLSNYAVDETAERNEKKYNLFFTYFLKKLNKIQIMLSTKQFIPYEFIFVDLISMIDQFIPLYSEWFNTLVHLIFMDYTKYESAADPENRDEVIFTCTKETDQKPDQVRMKKGDYFNLLSVASPCVN